MIKEQWQADIVIRDLSDDMCLLSKIANMLYSMAEYPMAEDRDGRLVAEYPEFVARLTDSVAKCVAKNQTLLTAWKSREEIDACKVQ